MENLGFNFTDVNTDTENNLNDYSLSPKQRDWRNDNQTGGFFWSSSSANSKNDIAALEIARMKNFDILEKIFIDKDLMNNYEAKDENGNTILHYLIMDSNHNFNFIKKILDKATADKIINIQNNEGDTPLILSVKSGDHELSGYLVKKGADKNIKNKQGFHVDSETEMPENINDKDITVQRCNLPQNSDSYMKRTSDIFIINTPNRNLDTEIDEVANPLFQLLNRKRASSNQTSEPESIQGNFGTETQDFASQLANKYQEQSYQPTQPKQSILPRDEDNTEELIKKIDQKTSNSQQQAPFQVQAGGCGCDAGLSKDTDTMISNIENFVSGKTQAGGNISSKRNTKSGQRRLNKNEDKNYNFRVNRNTQSRQNKNNNSRQDELSRLVGNQTEDIHIRVIKKILSILSENENKLKIEPTEEYAKAIKSLLWEMTKQKNPSIKSPFDLSVEMEKLTTLDNIKSFNINEIKDKKEKIRIHLEEKLKKRQNKNQDQDKRKNRKQSDNSSLSNTSSDEISNQGNLSETSLSD